MQNFYKNILRDVKTNLMDEFDRNFERKAFFDRPWSPTKLTNNKGSLMMRTGALRRSLKGTISGESIVFNSSLPYASIHNEGGEIVVTQKMKKFFWAMYYKASGAVKGKSQRDVLLTQEAAQWKALALQKVGARMKIEQRQFIGDHPQVKGIIEQAIDSNLKELNDYMLNQLKQRK